MKIGFLSLMNGSHWGGSEECWFRLALWMAGEGHEVTVTCYDWPEKNSKLDLLREAGAMVHLLPSKKTLFTAFRIKRILDLVNREKQDLVFVNQGGYKEVVYPPFNKLPEKLGKYILAFHNYDESETLRPARKNSLEKWMRSAALNVGASARIFEVIEKNFGIKTPNQEVWPNPVTFAPSDHPEPYPSLENGHYHWSVLAELDIHRKAQDLLIETLSADKWKNRNWILHLYGKGKDGPPLQEMINQYQLQDKIKLEGFSTDVKDILRSSHLLLQCTRIDAMPLSVVEAMAMARPCLVSHIGEMPAWITHENNGWVCNELTIEGLDQALEKCWEQRDRWEQMGSNAYQRFREKYPIPYEASIFRRLRSIS